MTGDNTQGQLFTFPTFDNTTPTSMGYNGRKPVSIKSQETSTDLTLLNKLSNAALRLVTADTGRDSVDSKSIIEEDELDGLVMETSPEVITNIRLSPGKARFQQRLNFLQENSRRKLQTAGPISIHDESTEIFPVDEINQLNEHAEILEGEALFPENGMTEFPWNKRIVQRQPLYERKSKSDMKCRRLKRIEHRDQPGFFMTETNQEYPNLDSSFDMEGKFQKKLIRVTTQNQDDTNPYIKKPLNLPSFRKVARVKMEPSPRSEFKGWRVQGMPVFFFALSKKCRRI